MHKYLNVHFHIQSTNTPTCFDLLHVILRQSYMQEAYIKHRRIIKQIKIQSLKIVDIKIRSRFAALVLITYHGVTE
jgi:hypothetical protein